MRAIVQRVSRGAVTIEGRETASIGRGLVALVGFAPDDTDADLQYMVEKLANLRVFEDAEGKMNLSVADVGGAMLLVPNFTIYADCRKGRRPSFAPAAPPHQARDLFDRFVALAEGLSVPVQAGVFGAHMHVSIENDGPVTLILDSPRK